MKLLAPDYRGFLISMKKLKISGILGIGVIGFIFCIGISIIAKKAFDVESDFLSASATLFAAIVALYLFSDWREQYRIEMVKQLRDKIHLLFIDLENKYNEFYLAVGSAVKGSPTNMKDIASLSQTMANSYEILLPEIDFLIKILEKLKVDRTTCKSNSSDFEEKFSHTLLALTHGFDKNNYEKTIINYWSVLSTNELEDYIKLQKTLINDDLQKLIIKLYDAD